MIPPMMDLNPQQVIAVEEVDDNLNVQAEVQLPVFNGPGENFLHHEIPEEDLMNLEEGNLQGMPQAQQVEN